jgi:hypothetical protein
MKPRIQKRNHGSNNRLRLIQKNSKIFKNISPSKYYRSPWIGKIRIILKIISKTDVRFPAQKNPYFVTLFYKLINRKVYNLKAAIR